MVTSTRSTVRRKKRNEKTQKRRRVANHPSPAYQAEPTGPTLSAPTTTVDGEIPEGPKFYPSEDIPDVPWTESRSCSICEKLEDMLMAATNEDGFGPAITLGRYEAVMNEVCTYCRPIFALSSDVPTGIDANDIITVERLDVALGDICIRFESEREIKETLYLARSRNYEEKHQCTSFKGLTLDQDWTNIDWLRDCINNCFSKHGMECEIRSSRPPLRIRPMWLIDIKHMCITSATNVMRYYALSYVWGQTEMLQLTSTNVEQLQWKKSLISSTYRNTLPDTIMHAIQLVQLLGGNYLWVDSLCIVQDDESEAHQQINSMASIYANADVTIVAKEGKDAHHGLPGIKDVSPPRTGVQRVHRIAGRIEVIEPQLRVTRSFPWDTRGWTFQEDKLSTRKIIFTDTLVQWRCSYRWAEDYVTMSGWRVREEQDFTCSAWPNFTEYCQLVYDYNQRALTYAEDALRAFAGVTTTLSYSFEGGFLAGLPELFFDAALLWDSFGGERRKASSPSEDHFLPSWTWAGRRNAGYRPNHVADYHIPRFLETGSSEWRMARAYNLVSRVLWYSSETPTGRKKLLESNSLLEGYKRSSQDYTNPLPAGWSRCRFWGDTTSNSNVIKEPQDLRYDEDIETYYTHVSDPATRFWYPIPIRDQATPVPMKTLEPFIHCRTQRGYLSVSLGLRTKNVILRIDSGQWAGKLRLDEDHEIGTLAKEKDSVTFELILISEGQVPNSMSSPYYPRLEWDHPERPKEGRIYKWINVLAIEWKDGIAYRKGLGRVAKSVWETLELEEIDVTLN
ncbi:heterokaryon incompatibility protein-domain-containing protein [Lophiotrema nucula]|uniref:Heterokaryon incompatibility protein-domain-containing protein n=1 Tax=Lophiotrema nucula TaxID=690887 RepID=A0A6A5YMC9_9PLEO|nr:heterokaryon incompatibility protein-domain-containing protein [Lophiotrema nucula]